MRNSLLLILFTLLCLLGVTDSSAGSRPVVAVFDIELKRLKKPTDLTAGLAEHLATLLTQSGRYRVIPRDQLRSRLSRQQKTSHKSCYDQSCQIEMGREMAAEKTLATRIIKIGKICKVNLTLYDLRSAATDAAASAGGPCDEESLLHSLEQAVNKLSGQKTKATTRTATSINRKDIEGMVLIPAGTFTMGCDGNQNHCDAKEQPKRNVTLPAFAMDRHEVTVEEYERCVKAKSCRWPSYEKFCNNNSTFSRTQGRERHPLNCAHYEHAETYCKFVGKRLPTEAEWERAARGTDGRTFPWGEEKPDCSRSVWDEHGLICSVHSTWPVCLKPAGFSPDGLCDMAGNVAEWTLNNSGDSKAYILRGGSWTHRGLGLSTWNRRDWKNNPGENYRQNGFRCAADQLVEAK